MPVLIYVVDKGHNFHKLGYMPEHFFGRWNGHGYFAAPLHSPMITAVPDMNAPVVDEAIPFATFINRRLNGAPHIVCVGGASHLVDFHEFASFPEGRKWAK